MAERSEVGRGIREITLDVVQPEDFLKGQHFVCLIHFLCFYVSARIPLPPAVATLPPAPSPRGKVRAYGARGRDKSQFVASWGLLFYYYCVNIRLICEKR